MRTRTFGSAMRSCRRTSQDRYTPRAGFSSTSPSVAVACFASPLRTGWPTPTRQISGIGNRRFGQFRCHRERACFSMQSAPGAPAGARALSPQDLASWLMTTRDAKRLLFQWPWPSIRISEQREHRALVVLLAEELYHRERGSLPLPKKRWSGLISIICPTTARATSTMERRRGLRIRELQYSASRSDAPPFCAAFPTRRMGAG